MISAIELKKRVAGARIFGIIIGKLYHRQKPCPVLLLEVDKGPKISFNCAILPFNPAVRLKVEYGEEFS